MMEESFSEFNDSSYQVVRAKPLCKSRNTMTRQGCEGRGEQRALQR